MFKVEIKRAKSLCRCFLTVSVLFSAESIAQLDDLPEVPSIDREVHLVLDESFTRPYMPVLQTTSDGRVGINHKALRNFQTGPGTNNDNGAAIRLLVPEKINEAFIESSNGPGILGLPVANSIPFDELVRGSGSTFRTHLGLCDPTGSANNQAQNNPYDCNGDDCYDLMIITTTFDQNSDQTGDTTLWGTPINVRVKNPKTADAFIESIEITGEVIEGNTFRSRAFLEPIIIGGGKMLVFRRGAQVEFEWTNEHNQTFNSRSDAVYMINDDPDSQIPCDITQWDKMYPFSHAPYDSTVNQRFGFAMLPFRDPMGQVIEDGVPLGSYPWIDKKGDNASIVMFETPLFSDQDQPYPSGSQYPVRCPSTQNNCLSDEDSHSGGPFQGRVIFGLWTNGKMIPIDGLINNSDYSLRQEDSAHREIELYQNENGLPVWKRVGTSRDTSVRGLPDGGAANTTFFDTQENLFNYFTSFTPVSPKDITWLVSSGSVSEEFSFDDYINPNGFIISEMFQSSEVIQTTSRSQNVQHNGFVNGVDVGNARIANSATALEKDWLIPPYGNLIKGRIETIANGGIKGKGTWMDGFNTRIEYEIPSQNRNVLDSSWFISVFLDPRFESNGLKTLIHFPDNSEIMIRDNNQLVFIDSSGDLVHELLLPFPLTNNNWTQLAFQIIEQNTRITTFFNGFAFDNFSLQSADEAGIFKVVPGTLRLGNKSNQNPGFKGWVDDFKIFASQPDLESVCNMAYGTLVGVSNNNQFWANYASVFPLSSHDNLTALLRESRKTTFARYACYHDYSGDNQAHLQNIPQGVYSIRDSVIFPEGPVYSNAARPDSTQNHFCLSCHTPDGKKGLGMSALTKINIPASVDARRTPMQPAQLVFGNIPQNWLGPNKPEFSIVTDNNGLIIDDLILPNDTLFADGFE